MTRLLHKRRYTDLGATFSADRLHRYTLWRRWDRDLVGERRPTVLWAMLNPSTADEHVLDPTVRRCEDFSKAWGFGGLVVVNLYSWRATDPADLYVEPGAKTGDPWNVAEIIVQARQADLVVTAWGKHGRLLNRGALMLATLQRMVDPGKLYHLGLNGDGSPKHPLYQPGNAMAQGWPVAPATR